jgi:hypothetical protein
MSAQWHTLPTRERSGGGGREAITPSAARSSNDSRRRHVPVEIRVEGQSGEARHLRRLGNAPCRRPPQLGRRSTALPENAYGPHRPAQVTGASSNVTWRRRAMVFSRPPVPKSTGDQTLASATQRLAQVAFLGDLGSTHSHLGAFWTLQRAPPRAGHRGHEVTDPIAPPASAHVLA